MPDFSLDAATLDEVVNSALHFYLDKGEVHYQTIQQKPIVSIFEEGAKDFSGGRGAISVAVKGAFGAGGTNDGLAGFQMDDSVNFYNPRNTRRAEYVWKEMHLGITFSFTEMKVDGLTVGGDNTAVPQAMRRLSGREQHALTNMIDEKLADMSEQYARSLSKLLWGDGTTDAKALTGIRAFITDNPATGTVGGIDRATASWWRNKTALGASAITSNPDNGGALLQFLQREMRQLRRYGGNPDTFLCGSDFLDAYEREVRANGLLRMDGFTGKVNTEVGGVAHGRLTPVYEPALDDLGFAKRAYIWDSSKLFLMRMPGEWKRTHSPARPHNKFTIYRSITCTGQVVATQLNSAGVYAIA